MILNMAFWKQYYIKIILLSVLAGILTAVAWQNTYLFPLQIIGFVPFLFAVLAVRKSSKSFLKKILNLLLITFVFRGVALSLGLYWLFDVSVGALIILVSTDVILVSLILIPSLIRRVHFSIIVPLFILFEYLMQNSLMLAPFYLMGYAWSIHISLIQYYSLLGVEGGSLMIYLMNYAIFECIRIKRISKLNYAIFSIFILLTTYSIIKYYSVKDIEWDAEAKISLLHSEINFSTIEYVENPNILVDEVQKVAAKNSLIVLPESFFTRLDWYEYLPKNKTIRYIDSLNQVNNQQVLLGAMIYRPTNHPTPQSRVFEGRYYNTHNISLLKDKRIHIKSKQVFIPFLEYIPSNAVAQQINKWVPTVGDARKVNPMDIFDDFKYKDKRFNILLCYASIFPNIVTERSQSSTFLTIQANENWHTSHTCSYQYLNINKANTIQVGIPTYRSSNYGYTAFIKPNGDTEYLYKTGKPFSALVVPLPKRVSTSFYTKIAGYSYWLSGIGIGLLFLLGFLKINPKK